MSLCSIFWCTQSGNNYLKHYHKQVSRADAPVSLLHENKPTIRCFASKRDTGGAGTYAMIACVDSSKSKIIPKRYTATHGASLARRNDASKNQLTDPLIRSLIHFHRDEIKTTDTHKKNTQHAAPCTAQNVFESTPSSR